MGLPIRDAIDAAGGATTSLTGHLNDIQVMRIMADTITGVNDNLRGIQHQQVAGGRRPRLVMAMQSRRPADSASMAVRVSGQAFSAVVHSR
jgi:hypothetical protein